MFPHLCRACLSELSDRSDIVPLFESHDNVLYYRMCNTIQLSVQQYGVLGRTVCKSCAENIVKFYNFHLMYKESDRKLREMLHSQTFNTSNVAMEIKPNVEEVGFGIEQMESIVQTSLGTIKLKRKCRKCSIYFATPSLLRNHVRQVHRMNHLNNDIKKGLKCAHCSTHFQTKQLQNKHVCYQNDALIEATEVRDNLSDTCDNDFHFDSDVKVEADTNSSDEKEFKEALHTQNPIELLVQTTVENFEIKTENEISTNDDTIVTTQSIRNDPNPMRWNCNKCFCDFETLELLEIHRRSHLVKQPSSQPTINSKRWRCSICLDTFSTRRMLQKHRREQHSHELTKEWKCSICQNTFSTRAMLKKHRREQHSHEHAKEWHCSICQDTFSTRAMLKKHRREQHLHDRKLRKSENVYGSEYTCELCNKTFQSMEKIKKHMYTHRDKAKDKKQHLCVICGVQLCSPYSLNIHTRNVHGGEQNFRCTQCGRRFSQKQHLKTHMNRHKGVRPFSCKLCNKSFYDTSAMHVHTNSVHLNIKAHICTICLRPFNRSGNLKTHMVKTHRLE